MSQIRREEIDIDRDVEDLADFSNKSLDNSKHLKAAGAVLNELGVSKSNNYQQSLMMLLGEDEQKNLEIFIPATSTLNQKNFKDDPTDSRTIILDPHINLNYNRRDQNKSKEETIYEPEIVDEYRNYSDQVQKSNLGDNSQYSNRRIILVEAHPHCTDFDVGVNPVLTLQPINVMNHSNPDSTCYNKNSYEESRHVLMVEQSGCETLTELCDENFINSANGNAIQGEIFYDSTAGQNIYTYTLGENVYHVPVDQMGDTFWYNGQLYIQMTQEIHSHSSVSGQNPNENSALDETFEELRTPTESHVSSLDDPSTLDSFGIQNTNSSEFNNESFPNPRSNHVFVLTGGSKASNRTIHKISYSNLSSNATLTLAEIPHGCGDNLKKSYDNFSKSSFSSLSPVSFTPSSVSPAAAAAAALNKKRVSGEPRKCVVCDRAFKYPSDLKKHEQIHTEIKKYSCDECKKSFRRLHQLNVHKRIHTGEKPYVCSICGLQFRHDSTLTMHKRTRHDHLKPFRCDVCCKAFGRMSHLRKHQKFVCRQTNSPRTPSIKNNERVLQPDSAYSRSQKRYNAVVSSPYSQISGINPESESYLMIDSPDFSCEDDSAIAHKAKNYPPQNCDPSFIKNGSNSQSFEGSNKLIALDDFCYSSNERGDIFKTTKCKICRKHTVVFKPESRDQVCSSCGENSSPTYSTYSDFGLLHEDHSLPPSSHISVGNFTISTTNSNYLKINDADVKCDSSEIITYDNPSVDSNGEEFSQKDEKESQSINEDDDSFSSLQTLNFSTEDFAFLIDKCPSNSVYNKNEP